MRQRANKVTGCPYCHLYHDNLGMACKVCDTPPTEAVAADSPVTPQTVLVPLSVAKPSLNPRISGILVRLRQAGLKNDSEIADGLRTGRVSQVLGFKLEYEYLIDYLLSKGFSVASYRYRVVCGSAESEYGQQAA